jgi:hypothetical protein
MEEVDAVEDLEYEAADEVERESVVAVGLDEFVEVQREKREGHALGGGRSTILPRNWKKSLISMQFLEETGSFSLMVLRILI